VLGSHEDYLLSVGKAVNYNKKLVSTITEVHGNLLKVLGWLWFGWLWFGYVQEMSRPPSIQRQRKAILEATAGH